MDITFDNIIDILSSNVFGGSTTLAALALMLAAWAVFAVICLNMKASPAYTVVPLIPISIFFAAKGLLNTTVMVIIVLVAAALVAAEFRKVVD